MARRLPPLNGLRAFEAAARSLSFTKAAEELNVTPAAVSHQVATLEHYLGVRLFRRHPKGLLLTEMGQRALPGVSTSGKLASLASGMGRMDVEISHPSHSGMQMDQISLLFIPMRYVETVEIDLDGAGFVTMTGSISLSENPRVSLAVPQGTKAVDVTMTDTDGTVATASKTLAGS